MSLNVMESVMVMKMLLQFSTPQKIVSEFWTLMTENTMILNWLTIITMDVKEEDQMGLGTCDQLNKLLQEIKCIDSELEQDKKK